MAHPPVLAQRLVGILVPAARRDGIIGDLLEEYSQPRAPARGVAAADRWFIRQAIGFLWSACAGPGLLVGSVITVRTLVDAAAPVADSGGRAWITTLAVMLIFGFMGFGSGLSRRHLGGVAVTALGATAVGTLIAYAGALGAMAVAQTFLHPDAAAWAGLREGLDVPAPAIAIIGTALGSVGALFGRAFPEWYAAIPF
jgi:hypothetical protein